MRKLYWHVPTWAPTESYYRLSTHMQRGLAGHGVEVVFLPPGFFRLPGPAQQQLAPGLGAGNTIFAGTCGNTGGFEIKIGRAWALTMWESTRLPADWVRNLRRGAERVIVPCAWCADVFGSELDVPVHTVPLGIDPHEFRFVARPDRDTYTFLALGDRGMRKGWDVLLAAFAQAFGAPGEPNCVDDVRLLLKVFEPCTSMLGTLNHWPDRRVRVWRENLPSMLEAYRLADCFVFPSRAEGWGLPPREAAATGLPVICTDYSGMAGDVENWGLPLDWYEVEAGDRYPARWAQPDFDHLVSRLRWCYSHRDEAKAFGRRASAWVHANQTWDHSAVAFVELLEAYA